MPQAPYTNSGMTLVELLVASILIGIVMVGVAGFSLTMRSLQDSSQKATVLATRMTAAISHMNTHGLQATGDWTALNPTPENGTSIGVVLGDFSGAAGRAIGFAAPPAAQTNALWLAFRSDLPITPDDYSDDTWFIYWMDDVNNDGSVYTLYYCEQPEGAGNELGPDPEFLPPPKTCDANSSLTLLSNITAYTWNFVATEPGQQFHVDISLTNQYDPTQAMHPVDNPNYTLSTRISPVAHAWGPPP